MAYQGNPAETPWAMIRTIPGWWMRLSDWTSRRMLASVAVWVTRTVLSATRSPVSWWIPR